MIESLCTKALESGTGSQEAMAAFHTFGKTAIHTLRVGLNITADAHLGDFTSAYSSQLDESMEELIPADILGKLPNLQYFASVSGGWIIKGRFPILIPDHDHDQPAARVAA